MIRHVGLREDLMSTELRYALPVDQTDWVVNGQTQTVLRWEYEDGRDSLLKLYDKGKKNQWDAADRIDWSQNLDPENPMQMPDHVVAKFYAATQVIDEARYVEAYERDIREEFVVEGCYHMRDRFLSEELWEVTGLPKKECIEHVTHSESMKMFRRFLFSRIVPIVKDIGLWGPKVQKAFTDMGVIEFSMLDSSTMMAQDEEIARAFDVGGSGFLLPQADFQFGTAD
jgi:hypothetical protein